MSDLVSSNEKEIAGMLRSPSRHQLAALEEDLAAALIARGFIEVKTPAFVSVASLEKMTITPEHPLYKQVFMIDDKRCLRPMHAMNLYYVMRKLRDHTDGPVKIFEIGSCFRKESHSGSHLEEFTMLNLVELGPEGDATEALKDHIGAVMKVTGLEYTLVREESDVYVETLDVEIDGGEVASGAVGPHVLDNAHDIHEPWSGIGFGLERLLMIMNEKSTVKKTGRSLSYLNGAKIN
ncbi:pyrrolysine--tRNA ligase [Candidatus Methanoplasma termitum]|uniref:PylS protein n=1 Tax=Candidatus Methanoplasma termitum TaxID=1577791 RepID=A0A0A7LBC5_9ARCH|nr:pyrrolysine--tRNA(Pyl) ligase large subunit [Candidatus Methanoplasma termitum]AIZ56460.1 pyrrolysine--tRNA ligase [Candidatus Methanoplasma termitum]